MGIENPVHLLFIAVIALIVLGPRRLPELTRAAGRAVREFREAIASQGEPPEDVPPADARAGEPTAPHRAGPHRPGMEQEHSARTVEGPTSVPASASAADPAGGSAGDPARPLRSGDAPDRRPL